MTTLSTDPPLLLRVEDAAELLNVGRSTVYDLIRSRRLRSVKIGRRRLIPRDAIADVVADLVRDS